MLNSILQHKQSLAEKNAQAMAGAQHQALKQMLDVCTNQTIFVELEAGTLQSRRVHTRVGAFFASFLPPAECVLVLPSGHVLCLDPQLQIEHDLAILVDSALLRVVLNETVSNGLKYRNPKTPIVVTVTFALEGDEGEGGGGGGQGGQEGVLCMNVENQNAPGAVRLTDDECAKVLKRGYRGSNALGTSTGLGLSTATSAVAAAGGTLVLSTREDSFGLEYTASTARFPATLPPPAEAAPDAAAPAATAAAVPAQGGASTAAPTGVRPSGLSFLVADDIALARLMMTIALKRICPDCTVQQASTAEQVLEMVMRTGAYRASEAPPFDVLLLDGDYGEGSRLTGEDLFERIRAMHAVGEPMPGLSSARRPILISTTADAASPSTVERVLACGADLVWGKPTPTHAEMAAQLDAFF